MFWNELHGRGTFLEERQPSFEDELVKEEQQVCFDGMTSLLSEKFCFVDWEVNRVFLTNRGSRDICIIVMVIFRLVA